MALPPVPYNTKALPQFLVDFDTGLPYVAGSPFDPVSVEALEELNAVQGAIDDPAVTDPTDDATVISLLKGLLAPAGYSYSHITTSTTTTVKASAGTIHSISVNTKGTVASVTTLKDNATVLAVIDSLNLSGTWVYDIACATSIVVVTTGAPDVTVSYR